MSAVFAGFPDPSAGIHYKSRFSDVKEAASRFLQKGSNQARHRT